MIYRFTIPLFFLLASFYSYSLTLDYRHDYLEDWKENRDRILLSYLIDNNIGGSIEQRFKSTHAASTPFNRMFYNGTELNVYYNIRMGNDIVMQPGFIYDRTFVSNTYEPYVTLKYIATKALILNLRGRHEYDHSRVNGRGNASVNRLDVWSNYKIGKYNIGLSYMIKKGSVILYNNKKYDYSYNGSLSYSITRNFTPYIEIGNVSVNRIYADRQTRYRLGIKYTF